MDNIENILNKEEAKSKGENLSQSALDLFNKINASDPEAVNEPVENPLPTEDVPRGTITEPSPVENIQKEEPNPQMTSHGAMILMDVLISYISIYGLNYFGYNNLKAKDISLEPQSLKELANAFDPILKSFLAQQKENPWVVFGISASLLYSSRIANAIELSKDREELIKAKKELAELKKATKKEEEKETTDGGIKKPTKKRPSRVKKIK